MEKKEGIHDHNWYSILGISVTASDDEISKAARKMFLKYHPDKTSDPEAPAKFLLVQQAKEVLLDTGKRKEIDDLSRSTAKRKEYDSARDKNMNDRRKKMKEELEKRMMQSNAPANHASASTQKNNDHDVEMLRKQSAKWKEAAAQKSFDAERARMREFDNHRNLMAEQNSKLGKNTQVKLKWKRSHVNHSDDSIYQEFKKFGDIEEVILTGDKGNTAVITFSDYESAKKAVEELATSTEYRLDIISDESLKKKAAVFTHVYDKNKISFSHDNPGGDMPFFQSEVSRAMERDSLLRSQSQNQNDSGDTDVGGKNNNAGSQHASNDTITAASLATKEHDVLAKMMKLAALKKSKS